MVEGGMRGEDGDEDEGVDRGAQSWLGMYKQKKARVD